MRLALALASWRWASSRQLRPVPISASLLLTAAIVVFGRIPHSVLRTAGICGSGHRGAGCTASRLGKRPTWPCIARSLIIAVITGGESQYHSPAFCRLSAGRHEGTVSARPGFSLSFVERELRTSDRSHIGMAKSWAMKAKFDISRIYR